MSSSLLQGRCVTSSRQTVQVVPAGISSVCATRWVPWLRIWNLLMKDFIVLRAVRDAMLAELSKDGLRRRGKGVRLLQNVGVGVPDDLKLFDVSS